ncbi:MAG TPA: hypothetical protein VFD41_12820 [Actinomycetales bacterium]|nr:hypothetical protein [Actinomycetales bacterium]
MERAVGRQPRDSSTVRVQRNGNSKVLPLPADVARALDVHFGATYVVEVSGDDVVYHRVKESAVAVSGSAGARIGTVPDTEVSAAPQRVAVPELTWDF